MGLIPPPSLPPVVPNYENAYSFPYSLVPETFAELVPFRARLLFICIIYALGIFYRIAEQGDDIPGTQDFATYLQAGVRMVYAERLRAEDDQLWSRPPDVDFKVEEPPSIDIDTMFAKIEAVHERESEALDALTQEEMMVMISLAVYSDKPEEMSDFLALFLDWVYTQYGPDQWRVPSLHEIGNETLADLIDKANLTSKAVDQKSDVSDGDDAENS